MPIIGQSIPIDVLSDEDLLAIFHFVSAVTKTNGKAGAWQSLVHVCRRWRGLIFGSPRGLNLRLVCTSRTPARESLDIWPALPLEINGTISSTPMDNIVAALGHRDRVSRIDLLLVNGSLQWDKVLAAMQVPFPALTALLLQREREYEPAPVIPDTFLGGAAPSLQHLDGMYFISGITRAAFICHSSRQS
jgi:hypothetical protein